MQCTRNFTTVNGEDVWGSAWSVNLLLDLDDIVVFSSSVDQHLARLEVVLSHLKQEELKVKLEKYDFFKKAGSVPGTSHLRG